MKTLLLAILLATPFAHAELTWQEYNQRDSHRFTLCGNSETWSELEMNNCLNEIFFKRHTESYYGAQMFASDEDSVKDSILQLFRNHVEGLPTWGYDPSFEQWIDLASKVA